jgi:hypothetical protein
MEMETELHLQMLLAVAVQLTLVVTQELVEQAQTTVTMAATDLMHRHIRAVAAAVRVAQVEMEQDQLEAQEVLRQRHLYQERRNLIQAVAVEELIQALAAQVARAAQMPAMVQAQE